MVELSRTWSARIDCCESKPRYRPPSTVHRPPFPGPRPPFPVPRLPFLLFLLVLLLAAPALGDRVELLSGSKVEGEVIDRDEQSITLRIKQSGRTYTRKYPVNRLHAVVIGDKREVLNAKEGEDGPSKPQAEKKAASHAAASIQRTRAEVESLIDEQGRAKPDWWDATPLDYPKSLDLSWPEPAPGGWNNQRNIGQYLWDVIHPNPNKWREGVRFVHHLLTVHKDDREVQRRAMNTLGHMYFVLLQDYPRAAFWFRKAGVDRDDRFWSGVQLAECYWRLGNKEMATELLDRLDPQFSMIKLLGDMGETQRALRFAEANRHGEAADLANLLAGDACRVAGQHRRALAFYQKVLEVPAAGQAKGRIERNQRRAQANIEAIKLFDLLDLARVPDGTYRSSSLGYEAQVHVEVVVKSGRIESVRVTDHHEKQYYASMIDTPKKIIARQGVTGIDATSCATITSEAIINATAKALTGAMK